VGGLVAYDPSAALFDFMSYPSCNKNIPGRSEQPSGNLKAASVMNTNRSKSMP